MVVHRAIEQKHDLHLLLYMAHIDKTVFEWWQTNVLFTDKHCEHHIQSATPVCRTLLGMVSDNAPPRALLLKYPMGSGKTRLQLHLLAELVTKAKSRIQSGAPFDTMQLPYPTQPAVVVVATIAEREAFADLLRAFPCFDCIEDIFVITESFRASPGMKAAALNHCFVIVTCLAGIPGVCSSTANHEASQKRFDAASAKLADGNCPEWEVGTIMTELLRSTLPTNIRRDLHVMPSLLMISEFNACISQLTDMLKLSPILSDILSMWSRTARWVILDGADIGDEAVRFASASKGLHRTYLHFCFAPPQSVKTVQFEEGSTFFRGLDLALTSGELVVINCDTVKDTAAIRTVLSATYGITDDQVFYCTGLDTQDHKMRLCELSQIAATHRVILTSPVLMRGISDSTTVVQHHFVLLRGTSIDGASTPQLMHRHRKSEIVHVHHLTHVADSSTEVADVAIYMASVLRHAKRTTRVSAVQIVPYIGGVNITEATETDKQTDRAVFLSNAAPTADPEWWYCECLVPSPYNTICENCNCFPVQMAYTVEATEGNPWVDVETYIPHWPMSNFTRTVDPNVRVLKSKEFSFESGLGGLHLTPFELSDLFRRLGQFKRRFRFLRQVHDAALTEGWMVAVVRDDHHVHTPTAKALMEQVTAKVDAATDRLAELVARLLGANCDYGLEQRVLGVRNLLGMDPTETPADFAEVFETFNMANWHSTPLAKEPNFFKVLFGHLGVSSALTPEPLEETLDCIGNRPTEWWRAYPAHFNIGVKAASYGTWLLGMVGSIVLSLAPIAQLTDLSGTIMACLTSNEIKWIVPVRDMHRIIANPLLSEHAEAIYNLTDGTADLRTSFTLTTALDAFSALMSAVLRVGLRKTAGKAAYQRGNTGVQRAASPATFTFPVEEFRTRLIILYARAQRGLPPNGRYSNDQIIEMLKGPLSSVPSEEWFIEGLSGCLHPTAQYPDLDGPTLTRTYTRVPATAAARLAAFTRAVSRYLKSGGKPERTYTPGRLRAFVSCLLRRVGNGDFAADPALIDAAYIAHHAWLDPLTGAADSDSDPDPDPDSDSGPDLSAMSQFYQDESDVEHEQQVARHAALPRTGTTYRANNKRNRTTCTYIDGSASESE
jgi:hypothetical protein